MIINWYGQNCFKIISQKVKNGSVSIIIDPPEKETGIRGPKIDSDILLMTDPLRKVDSGNHFLIQGAGEYDINGVYIQGVSVSGTENKITAYTIETEDINICHLGFLGQKELTSDQLEAINNIDILMVPVGGGKSINAEEAIKIMAQIEPKIIIPMNYRTQKTKAKTDGIDNFLKTLGIKSIDFLPKLSVKKKDLSGEEARIIGLQD